MHYSSTTTTTTTMNTTCHIRHSPRRTVSRHRILQAARHLISWYQRQNLYFRQAALQLISWYQRQRRHPRQVDILVSHSSSSASGAAASVQTKLSPKKEEKRYAHEFKKAIEESEKFNGSQTSKSSDDPTTTHQDESTRKVTTHIDQRHSNNPHPARSRPHDLASYHSNPAHRPTSPYSIQPLRNESDINN